MTGNNHQHVRPIAVLELVEPASTNIDPAVFSEPGNDFAGLGFDGRHGVLIAQHIAQLLASIKLIAY